MKTTFIILNFIVLVSSIVNYKDYSKFTVSIRDKYDLRAFEQFHKFYGDKVDYWHRTRIIGRPVIFAANGEIKDDIEKMLMALYLDYEVTTKSWQDLLVEKGKRRKRYVKGEKIDLGKYYSYNESIQYLQYLESKNKDIMKIEDLGVTVNGRVIKYVTFGYDLGVQKPTVIIETGLHGREWITYSSVLIFIDNLVKKKDKYHYLFKKINIIIIPNANPDGYEHSREHDRLWRGNRNLRKNSCGVDLNRNFDHQWNNKISECIVYPGDYPNSERETIGLIDLVKKNLKYVKGYLSVHSYGRYIIYPWNHKKEAYTKDHREMVKLAEEMINNIREKTNTSYTHNTGANLFYDSYGCGIDYMKSLGVKYTYAIELAPSEGPFIGFLVKETSIPSVAEEFDAAVLPFLNKIYEEA